MADAKTTTECTSVLKRVVAVLTTILTLLLGQAGTSQAQPSPEAVHNAGDVNISGDVHNPLAFTPDSLRALTSRTESVTFHTASGMQSHSYLGAPVDTLLAAAQPLLIPGAKHPDITLAVLATGADGYSVTLSWAEVSPALAPRPALVAWSEDEVPLSEARLVLPDDLTGARYVSALTDLRVIQLAAH
ncbi:MAG: molybdopterin-binding oxidoreductase [Mycobacterium sp.]